MVIRTIILLIFFSVAVANETESDFLADFIIGEYLLIGKKIDSDQTYFGRLKIYTTAEGLKITRTINKKTIIGDAAIETALAGEANVLRMRYIENNASYESTCLIQSDLDNYARISCYLYQPHITTDHPGLETLFINHNAY